MASISPPPRSAGPVTGELNATGCDIGVYNPTSVSGADISRRSLLRRRRQRRERQRDRQQGPPDRQQPVRRHAARPCHHLHQRRERHDQRQPGLRLPEERDRGHRPDRRCHAPSSVKTSATVQKNIVTGQGPIGYIAQNGIVIRDGASATVKNNTVSGFDYTPSTTEATGVLLYQNELGTFDASEQHSSPPTR